MKPLAYYIGESGQDRKAMQSAASYLTDKGVWERYQTQIIAQLNLPKLSRFKSWDELSKEEQGKVATFKKSLAK